MKEFKYIVEGETYTLETEEWSSREGASFLAEKAAEDFYDNGSWEGGEGSIEFTIIGDDEENWGTFEVEIDYSPVFYASEVKEVSEKEERS